MDIRMSRQHVELLVRYLSGEYLSAIELQQVQDLSDMFQDTLSHQSYELYDFTK